MKLVKTIFYSGISTVIRTGSNFVIGKVIALFTGPSGLAIVGAFSNFITIVLTFANGAINIGIVKYTAEFEDDEVRLKSLFSTALKISIYCSLIIGVFLLLLAKTFSKWIFTTTEYTALIKVLGITIVFYSLNSMLIAILNGKKQIRTYTIVNTIGSVIGLVLTVILSYFFRMQGALYAMVLAQSLVFLFTVLLIMKSSWFSLDFFRQSFDKTLGRKLSHYSLMAIVSALTMPISNIVLRNMIISKIDIEAAGRWQGMLRISDGYLLIVTTSLSTYYLPKLSSIKNNIELRKEIFHGFKVILPSVILGCISIYSLRFFIIKVLYTSSFLAMEELFFWQLVGDFFKMAAFILGYLMLAKAMTKTFILNEIIFSLIYVFTGFLFVDKFGSEGITMAFALTYSLSLISMLITFRKLVFFKQLI